MKQGYTNTKHIQQERELLERYKKEELYGEKIEIIAEINICIFIALMISLALPLRTDVFIKEVIIFECGLISIWIVLNLVILWNLYKLKSLKKRSNL